MNELYSDIDQYMSIQRNLILRPMESNLDKFHLHNMFEIYCLISGDVNYFIEKNSFRLQKNDVIIMNSNEIHKPSFVSNAPYERITLHFNPLILDRFSTEKFKLSDCFIKRNKGENNRFFLKSDDKDILFEKLMRMLTLKSDKNEYQILKQLYFIDLVVFLNQKFQKKEFEQETYILPDSIKPIIEYIDKNLDSDLSLEALERKFYINRYYLVRMFKKYLGNTLHKYILVKRISLAKKHLEEGRNATEASILSGFNDYSNFSKMFKRYVGSSPSRFRKETV